MKEWAVVDSADIVINKIIWDEVSQWSPPDGCILIDITDNENVDIGWTYQKDTGMFVSPSIQQAK